MVASLSPHQQPRFSWNKMFWDVHNRKLLVLSQSQSDPPVLCYYGKHIFFFTFQMSSYWYLCLIPTQLTYLGAFVGFSICWSCLRLWYRNQSLATTPKTPAVNASWRVCVYVRVFCLNQQQTVYLIHRLRPSQLHFLGWIYAYWLTLFTPAPLCQMNSCCSGNASFNYQNAETLHAAAHKAQLSGCREPFSFIYTHSSSVFRLTHPLVLVAQSLGRNFPPHFSLCPPWNCSSSELLAASDMVDVLLFGLISLQLAGPAPTAPGAKSTDPPWSALCTGTCGRLSASRCPADDDLDPANCCACCLDQR